MPAEPKATLQKVLDLLGFTATVDEHCMEEGVLLDVKTDDSGRLIGRQARPSRTCNTSPTACFFNRTRTRPK